MNNQEKKELKEKIDEMAEAIYVASCASHMQNFDHSYDELSALADMTYARKCAKVYFEKNRAYKPK